MCDGRGNSQSVEDHRAQAESRPAVAIAIVTVSDTRTPETDQNAKYLKEEIAKEGCQLARYDLVKDDPEEVAEILEACVSSQAQVILFNGGTGISSRDRTFDVISRKLDKTLTGFGEIFRMLSYEEVGAAAMLSRATAGIYQGKLVFSTPGSPNAVKVAWEKLIRPEMKHLVWELNR